MDTLEIKEEAIVDVVHVPHSHDEFSYEPDVAECLDPALPASSHFFFENSVPVEKLEVGDVELDPLADNELAVECPTVRDEQVALDQLSATFALIKTEDIMDSGRKTIEMEPKTADNAGILKTIKIELTGSDDVDVVSHIISLNPKYVKRPKIECSTSLINSDTNVRILKVETFTSEQDQERYIGPRTRKMAGSSTAHKMITERQDVVNKYDLKRLTVNIGPRMQLPHCLLPSLKLKIYSCNKCSSKFTDSSAYDSHVNLCSFSKTDCVGQSSSFYQCRICIYKFKKNSNLQSHVVKHPCKKFLCNVCAEKFSTVDELRFHGDKTHNDNSLKMSYACNMCNYSTYRNGHFKEHLIRHIPDRHLYCYRCRRNYEDESDYSKHWAKLHSNVMKRKIGRSESVHELAQYEISKVMPVQDRVDNINQYSDNKHKELTANDTNPLVVGNKLEKLRSSLTSEIIFKDGMYHCSVCIYTFFKLDNLKTHINLHFDTERPFKCYECKYESFSIVEMENHCKQVSHLQICKCNVCSFRATEWRYIKRHAINHIYDGLYCRQCRLNFENSESIKEHLLVEHEIASIKTLFSCKRCSYTHPNKISYLTHFSKNHLNEKKSFNKKISKVLNKNKLRKNHKNEIVFKQNKRITSPSQTTGIVVKSKNCHLKENCDSRKTSADSRHRQVPYNYKCAKCDFNTNKLKTFITHHSRKHASSEKPYQCSICYKKLSLLKHYLKHMKLHVGILIYECPFCNNYSSVNEVEFIKHAMNHELQACPMCVYKTCNLRLLENHIAEQHKHSPGAFACPLCPYCTREEQKLGLHCLKFHPVNYLNMRLPVPTSLCLYKNYDIIGCKLCEFKCKTTKIHDLKRHLIKHFANGSINKSNSNKLGRQVLKKSTFGLKTTSKINKSRLHNQEKKKYSMHYRCTKCNKKSKFHGTIHNHLRIVHNITGGLKNKMIVKFKVRLPKSSERNKTVNAVEDAGPRSAPVRSKSHNSSKSGIYDSLKGDSNKANVSNQSQDKSQYFCCSKCNMMSRHIRSVQRHLKSKHKVPNGGLVNNLIYQISRNIFRLKEELNSPTDTSASKPRKVDLPLKNAQDIRRINQSKSNNSITYQCAQCEFKRHSRHLVYKHLRRIHKTTGGLTNNKIFKIVEKLNKTLAEDSSFNQNKFKVLKKTQTSLNENVCIPNKENPVHKTSIKISKTSQKYDAYYHCSQCHLRTNNKKALMVHLSRHKIDKALKSNKTSKVIDESRSLSNERTTWSFKSYNDMPKMDTHPDCVLKAINDKKHQTKTSDCVNEKKQIQIPTSISFDLGVPFYFCVLCNYNFKNKLKQSLYEHLSTFHKVENEEMRNRWIKKSTMVSVFNKGKGKESVLADNDDDEVDQAEAQVIKGDEVLTKTFPLHCSATGSPSNFVSFKNPRQIQKKNSDSCDDKLNRVNSKCHLCNIHTLSDNAQVNHKNVGHTEFWKKSFFCKVPSCGARFTTFSSLKRHKNKHTILCFSCQICNKFSTYRRDTLHNHQISCSKKKVLTQNSSSSGGKYSITENTLTFKDIANNSDDEDYLCGECDYVTMDMNLFMKHMATHSGRLP